MVRLACISLPKIDLQILALRHPEWKPLPTVVVTEEKPLGTITAANKRAYAAGVKPGMRYASALTICPDLRAGVVDPDEREALRDRLIGILRRFTPSIEPARDDRALFWVDAGGLERIYGSLEQWTGSVERAIEAEGLVCSIAVGFTRFGTYAAAKVKRRITIFAGEGEERAAAMRAPVGVLPLDHESLARFHQLGILTIRDFTRFSPGALRRRFGPEVEQLQRFARGEETLPLQAVDERPVLRREMRLLYPEGKVEALLHHALTLLAELIAQAWSEQRLVSELEIELCPEHWPGAHDECLRERVLTSRPTVDSSRLERLLRLRLEHLELPGPVVRLALEVTLLPTDRAQEDLFADHGRRDPVEALAALADIRAELGNDAVQVAELRHAHLPEEQFAWRPLTRLLAPRPAAVSRPHLVRRILHEPLPLARLPGDYRLAGPYELSGGWWQTPYRREYYYLRDRHGRLLWLYYDAPASRWLVQGVVE